jgi:hypothetical protein
MAGERCSQFSSLRQFTKNRLMVFKNETCIVMDKEFTTVSGNKHDYMSQAPYFWYDSTKPNGLPYMRKMEYAILKFIRSLTALI